MSLKRAYGKIQALRRVAIPPQLMEALGWKIGDEVLIEAYKGKLIIENLSRTIKPLADRLRDSNA